MGERCQNIEIGVKVDEGQLDFPESIRKVCIWDVPHKSHVHQESWYLQNDLDVMRKTLQQFPTNSSLLKSEVSLGTCNITPSDMN